MFPLYFLHSLTLFSHLKVQAFAFPFPLYLAVLFPVFRVQRYAFSSLFLSASFRPLILHRSLINCLTFRSTRCSLFFSFRCIFPRLSLSLDSSRYFYRSVYFSSPLDFSICLRVILFYNKWHCRASSAIVALCFSVSYLPVSSP